MVECECSDYMHAHFADQHGVNISEIDHKPMAHVALEEKICQDVHAIHKNCLKNFGKECHDWHHVKLDSKPVENKQQTEQNFEDSTEDGDVQDSDEEDQNEDYTSGSSLEEEDSESSFDEDEQLKKEALLRNDQLRVVIPVADQDTALRALSREQNKKQKKKSFVNRNSQSAHGPPKSVVKTRSATRLTDRTSTCL